MSDTVTLCALLWAVPGRKSDLADFEDDVLALLPDHHGRLVSRVRNISVEDGPTEMHIISFRDQTCMDAYLADDRRIALLPRRDAAIDRTEVHRVDLIA